MIDIFYYIKNSIIKTKYLLQEYGYCCTLYSLCNALIYFNKSYPSPKTHEWRDIVKIAGCEYSPSINRYEIANYLGLELIYIDPYYCKYNIPSMLTVFSSSKTSHNYLHSVLVIGADDNYLYVINYKGKNGKEIEKIRINDNSIIPPVGHSNREAFAIKLKDTI